MLSLKLTNEPFSPHKASFARHTPAPLLSRAGSALLGTQRARAHALDVQHRQPAAGNGTVSREASRDQVIRDLDDTRAVYLVYLRSAPVEPVSQLYTRTCGWARRGHDRAEPRAHGSDSVALGVWLVFAGPACFAFCHAGGVKREPRARDATRMGAGVRILLDVLVGIDCSDGSCAVVVRTVFVEYLARRLKRTLRSR